MIIAASQLEFSYPARRRGGPGFTLRLDHWEVEQGSRVALFGPSGCGKSTLLNLVSGELVPQAGSLQVLGAELTTLSERQRRAHRIQNLGFIFQDFPLVDYLDATENVLFPYRLNPTLRLDREVRQRARQLLDELGLGPLARRRPAELSQGERQRLGIARALIRQPRLLLADEPTTGLDPQRTQGVMELLEGVVAERGLTLVMVTHDPGLLPRFDVAVDVMAMRDAAGVNPAATSGGDASA